MRTALALLGLAAVDEEGVIYFPTIGAIGTRDMTLATLRDSLRAGLERLFTDPFVTITPLLR